MAGMYLEFVPLHVVEQWGEDAAAMAATWAAENDVVMVKAEFGPAHNSHTRALVIHWERPVGEEYEFSIPIDRSLRGRRHGTVRPQVREWLKHNLPTGASKMHVRWEWE